MAVEEAQAFAQAAGDPRREQLVQRSRAGAGDIAGGWEIRGDFSGKEIGHALAGGALAAAAGLFGGTGKCGTGPSVLCQIKKSFGGVKKDPASPTGYSNGAGQPVDANGQTQGVNLGTSGGDPCMPGWSCSCGCAEGGSVRAARGGPIGCASTRHMGGLPTNRR